MSESLPSERDQMLAILHKHLDNLKVDQCRDYPLFDEGCRFMRRVDRLVDELEELRKQSHTREEALLKEIDQLKNTLSYLPKPAGLDFMHAVTAESMRQQRKLNVILRIRSKLERHDGIGVFGQEDIAVLAAAIADGIEEALR